MSTAAPSPAWGRVPSGERIDLGRWSIDLRGDEVADIRADGRLALRAIRAVARDPDWATAPARVLGMQRDDSSVTLAVEICGRGIDLAGTVQVSAQDDLLVVTLDARARTASATNRTGLAVLCPPDLAGAPWTLEHPGGEVVEGAFPTAISPHQPARDIAALTWRGAAGTVRLAPTGDAFEMEDQRNWSDASFKIYNRSLDAPFPYTLEAGERVQQQVSLQVLAPASAPQAPAEDAIALRRTGQEAPTIALGASTAPDPAGGVLGPTGDAGGHRHVELDLRDPAWPAALRRAQDGAADLSVQLVAAAPAPEDLAAVLAALAETPLRWIGVVDAGSHVSAPALVEALQAALAQAGREVPVASGARSHFTELNREWDRIRSAAHDALTFPTTPLFHTLETEQLVEAVAMQRVFASDVTSRAPGTPVHIGPVTLRPRLNNVATRPAPLPAREDLAEGYGAQHTGADDARQDAPELAAWTIASGAALAVPGVGSLTYFEDWGPRGVRTEAGAVQPAQAAVQALSALTGGALWSGESPDGRLWALGAELDGTLTVLLANLGERSRTARLRCEGPGQADEEIAVELGGFDWAQVRL